MVKKTLKWLAISMLMHDLWQLAILYINDFLAEEPKGVKKLSREIAQEIARRIKRK